jgi:pimeloyl-ACP methyl ester carboxylesterase
MTTSRLRHNAVDLALHQLSEGTGRPLLLLHGLGERTPAGLPDWLPVAWPGPVYGLDFTGHGGSTVPVGGGYSSELLMGDADHALAAIGPATVLGRGLGAYVALLVAGGRPHIVRGAILCDGPGLAGGGVGPTSSSIVLLDRATPPGGVPDPWALVELSRDVRPPDYAASFARLVNQFCELPVPLAVCARWRPPWVEAVVEEPGVADLSLAEALTLYQRAG